MPIKKRIVEKSLCKKGFVKDDSPHHRYFHHEVDGKRTGLYTYTSHGSSHDEYDDGLVKFIKKQLKLNTIKQTKDLLKCPMSGDEYNQILRDNGDIF